MDDPNITLEQYKKYVKERIDALTPVFAKVSIGDFSSNVPIPEKEDEFSQLYVGIQLVLEAIRETIDELKKVNTELAAKTTITELEKLQDEAILDNIGEGLIVADQKGKILVFNKIAEVLMGVSTKEVEGKDLIVLLPMDDENGHKVTEENRPMTQALTTGKKTSGVFYYYRPDGTKFPAGITVTPLLFNGQIVGTIETFRDVTAEKELERMKDEFVSMSSHELRTPMTAIKGFMSMIFRGDFGPVNEGLKTPLQTIANSTERLISLEIICLMFHE
ncbi:MAG: PAS domain S-box protein [Patescibacteria group bacterium]|nr:PAS domain S-box protein [Patescibacteria group bacterium]